MGRNTKRILGILLVLVLAVGTLFSQAVAESHDIVVLYTNDVHCGIRADLGYEKLAAVKDAALAKTPYVVLVDNGDAIQGEEMGTVSKGEYPVEIMNKVGYDFAVLGNHEFDYGIGRLSELIGKADAQYLGCNLTYTGKKGNLLKAVKPYEIVDYGGTDVAFIGVSTPESITKSTPTFFQEDGKFVYGFSSDTPEELYAVVQKNIDEVRKEGADYVVVLSHLGTDTSSAPFQSTDLIANTTGIDVVLDGHSHSVIPCYVVADKAGKKVLLSSTGTKLNNIGMMVITEEGNIETSLIGEYPEKNQEVAKFVDSIEAKYKDSLSEVIGQTQVDLNIASENGIRMVRTRETNLGDLCADAYRVVANADIGFINGGGIRAPIAKGPITYGSLIKVHPYGNTLTMVEASGQEIIDALEHGSRSTKAKTSDGDKAIGESGGFLQVSGLKYTIDTSIPSSVELDSKGMFVSVKGARRVKDVMVQTKNGGYEPIKLEKTYKLACHNYMLKDAGDGYTMFQDNKLLINEGMLDNQVLMTYVIEYLDGVVSSAYAKPQGRITVI